MRSRIVTVGFCALALAGIARAEDLAPGLWELALEANVDAEPSFQPGPITVKQCLTKADARDPSKVLAPIATAGATGCSYSQKSYVGPKFRFAMQCSGTLELKTTGEVVFSATTLRGTITTTSSVDGTTVELKSTLSGHRLGDC